MNLYFVVDTDKYAGNFERELCAYMTGQVGECGVGEENAKRFEREVDEATAERMEWIVGMAPDDHGCHHPAKIYFMPGWFNNGHGGHFREDDPDAEAKALVARDEAIRKYAEGTIRKCYADKTYANAQADKYLQENLGEPLARYPAYQSVAIVLNEEPTEEDIAFLKERAYAYDGLTRVSHIDKSIKARSVFNIEGFRIVKERTASESTSV